MKITETQYAALAVSLAALGQRDLAEIDLERLHTLAYLLEAAAANVEIALTGSQTDTAHAEIARLRTALAWYADAENYNGFGAPRMFDPQAGSWHADGGRRARAAMAAAMADMEMRSV